MKPADLRKEPRVRSRGAVHLWTENTDPIRGSIRDVSVFGMCVETEIAAPRGIPVRIVGTGFTGAAIVRYCYACGPTFRLGLELVSEAAIVQPRVHGADAMPAHYPATPG
jgi:hypothetical protein